jgi:hypothetical protein
MRTGQYGALEMTSPPPEMRILDTRMKKTLDYARIMEFQSIELEVISMQELFLSQANEACCLIFAAGFRRECFLGTIP